MKNFDIEIILEDFKAEFNSGNLKKDKLPNSFPKFNGEIQQADDEAFERYRNSKLYRYIINL